MSRLKQILLYILVALSCTVTAGAEESGLAIRGKVLEKDTRKPLEHMTVFLADKEDTFVETARDGSFTMAVPAPGDYTLLATGPGYERSAPIVVSLSDSGQLGKNIVIYLMPVYSMTEVVVEGERNPDKTSKISITGKELSTTAGSSGDPLRGMQALPGFTSASDAFSNPAIRGSNPESNFYYVDFMPVGYLFHMGGLVSVINPDFVNDFNIYSSAFGPEFIDVTGGIIDVKLRDPRQDKIVRKINVSMLEADAVIDGPLSENKSFFVGARRSYYDLFVPSLKEKDGRTITQFPNYYDYQGKYVWKLSPDHTLTFEVNGANDEMEVTIAPYAKEAKRDPVLAGNFAFDIYYNMIGGTLNSRVSPHVNNTLGLSFMNWRMKQQVAQVGYVVLDQDMVMLRDNVTIAASPDHTVLLGVDYAPWIADIDLNLLNDIPSEWDPDTDFTSAERVLFSEKIKGYFAGFALKDRWKIAEPITLVIGGRASYDNYLDIRKAEPRFSAEYTVTADTLVTAGWGKYHEFPQGYQVIENFGNRALNYPQADHYVLGVEQQIVNGWSAKIEGYFKKLYNLVVPVADVNYLNAGSGRAYGAELLIKKNPPGNWWGWLSGAYSKTDRHNDLTGVRFPSPYDQPYIVNLVYNYKITPRWTIGAKWRYQSPAPFTPVIGTYQDATGRTRPIYGQIGSERLPAYHRLDLRFGAEIWSGTNKLEAYVDLINAYNHKNISGYEYDETYTLRKPIRQLPIIPSIGFKLEF